MKHAEQVKLGVDVLVRSYLRCERQQTPADPTAHELFLLCQLGCGAIFD